MMAASQLNAVIKINYPGSGNNSQFVFDGMGLWVKIVETAAGSMVSIKQFVWDFKSLTPSEVRDGSNAVAAQYFDRGQTIGGATNKYCYTNDQLGCVRELNDFSGNVQAQYCYDAYGQSTKIKGGGNSDFLYGNYYEHAPSGLAMTLFRAYSPTLGRWINRDPIEEDGGVNLYDYVNNAPVGNIDPFGLVRYSTNPAYPPGTIINPNGTVTTPGGSTFFPDPNWHECPEGNCVPQPKPDPDPNGYRKPKKPNPSCPAQKKPAKKK